MAEPNYFVWVLPLFILISAAIGYLASQRNINKHFERERKKEKEKIKTILHLLNDEISLRWFGNIGKQLNNLSTIYKDNFAKGLKCLTDVNMSTSDLYVFERVSLNFPEFFFLNDRELLSEVVYGHVLIRDLVDYLDGLEVTVKDLEGTGVRLEDICDNEDAAKEMKLGTQRFHWVKKKFNEYEEKIVEIDKVFKNVQKRISPYLK